MRDWPTEQYGAILADPPWRYKDVSYRGAAEGHYGTMALADIQALPVAAIARGDAALFLWATYPLLPEALSVVAAWGFEYKTVAFTWVKLNANGQPMFGAGRWTRANAEICLLATRGRPERRAMDVSQVILTRRRQHSQKPDEQYGRIMRLVDGPYCELFGRQVWPGWRVWGNDTANRGAQLLLELPA